jgi:serine protease
MMSRPTRPAPGDIDPVLPPPEVLARAGARVLDPATAARFAGQVLRPAVYVTDELLVHHSRLTAVRTFLADAAKELDLDPDIPGDVTSAQSGVVVRFRPLAGRAVTVDAWEVLQRARELAFNAGDDLRGVGLNHLMFVGTFGPAPYDSPQPYDAGYAPGSPYADLAYLGPRPVALPLVNPPARSEEREEYVEHLGRPVVAVVDTGCGSHPWLSYDVRRETFGSTGMATGDADSNDTEQLGNAMGRLDGLRDPFAGHGTFICGLVRQACPEAGIVSLPIVNSDGNNDKGALAAALNYLAVLIETGDTPVDVVSLSLGTYPEQEGSQDVLDVLLDAIQRLISKGVVVVAAAGNGGTTREFYPAAFAAMASQWPLNSVVSVGALNPNRRSITIFSNGGSWVKAWDVGAAVVSTIPEEYQHSLQARASTTDRETCAERASVDQDDFRGLFAVASGTSYAAPIMAGRIAGELFDQRCGKFKAARDAGESEEQALAEITLSAEEIAACVKAQADATHPPQV